METNPETPLNESPITEGIETSPEVQIDELKLKQFQEKLKFEQNLPFAILAGLASALIGAAIWAVITVFTKYQIGYMAVGVGFLVGFSVRYSGKGIDQIFGIIGGLFAFLGCLVGNLFSLIGFSASDTGVSFFEIFPYISWPEIPSIMMSEASPYDILFYGIAIYEGYKFAFREVSEEEVIQNAAKINSL